MMKRIVPTVACAIGLLLLSDVGRSEERSVKDSVSAVVNNEVITPQEILQRATPNISALARKVLEGTLSQTQFAQDRIAALNEALRQLIAEKLLVAEGERLAKKRETFAKAIQKQIGRYVEQERRQAGSEAAFRDALQKKGLTYEEYRRRLRIEILQYLVLDRFVRLDLTVSPGEAREYYQKNIETYRRPVEVKFRQIFVRAARYESVQKAREMAEYLTGLLKKQHDFGALAKQNSDGPHAKEGGAWAYTGKGAFPKPVDDLLFSLPVGGIGGPVRTDIGFTIIKVEARRPARTVPFEEVQGEIRQTLIEQKRRRRFKELIARLTAENYVESRPWEAPKKVQPASVAP